MAPWLALPFSHRDLKNQLSKKWKVRGIPTLVILDNKAQTITANARTKVSEDPTASEFPWHSKPLWDVLAGELINNKNEKFNAATHLKNTTAFGIYFSAHWCGPCRQFTPSLINTYKKLKQEDKKFEVVFVSADNDQHMFDEYFATMPWLAIPYSDSKMRDLLNNMFEVEGIPTLVLIDGVTGKVITKTATDILTADPEGKEFPWHPKALTQLDQGAGQLNDVACFIYIDPQITDEQVATLQKVAEHFKAKWQNFNETPLIFLYGKGGGMASRVKGFTNITADKVLMILNIPDGNKAVYDGSEYNETALKQFVDGFVAGTLKTRGIKE